MHDLADHVRPSRPHERERQHRLRRALHQQPGQQRHALGLCSRRQGVGGLVEGLSEGIHFAQNAGLDAEKVIEVISKGAAGSWQMENRWKTMNEGKYDHGFAVDWMRKDFDIVLAEARRNGSRLPVTALVDQFYSEVQAMGGKRWDTSSLLARLKRQ